MSHFERDKTLHFYHNLVMSLVQFYQYFGMTETSIFEEASVALWALLLVITCYYISRDSMLCLSL